jgi:hypothetical protein
MSPKEDMARSSKYCEPNERQAHPSVNTKAVLGGKFIALNAPIRTEERSKINDLHFCLYCCAGGWGLTVAFTKALTICQLCHS